MRVGGNHYECTSAGVLVHAEEELPEECPLLFSFADALSLDDSGSVLGYQDSQALAGLVERWIREHLAQHHEEQGIDSEALSAAFSYANQRLLKSDATGLNQVAVSVIVALPSADGAGLLIGGVGDSKLYSFEEGSLVERFFDPLNQQMKASLTPEERLFGLQNGIGIRENLLVQTVHVPLIEKKALLLASYGLHNQTNQEELLATATYSKDERDPFTELLSTKQKTGHNLHLKLLSVERTAEERMVASCDEEQEPCVNREATRRRQRLTAFGLSAATCALVLGVTAAMLDNSHEDERNASIIATPEQEVTESTTTLSDTAAGAERAAIDALLKREEEHLTLIAKLEEALCDRSGYADTALRDEVNSLRTLLAKEDSERGRIAKELDDSRRRISYLEDTIDTLENVAASRNEAEVEQQLAEIRETAKEQQRRYTVSLEDKDLTIAELQQRLERQEERLHTADEALAALERERLRNQKLAQRAIDTREKIVALEKQLAGEQSTVEELRERCEELTGELANVAPLHQAQRELEERLQKREQQIADLQETLRQQDSLITGLQAVREQLEREVASANQPEQTDFETEDRPLPRRHLVSRGETLSQLSTQYYGTSRRWQEIYEANKDVIADVDAIKVGTPLIIP